MLACQVWETCRQKILSGNYDLVVLDEMTCVLKYGWLPWEEVRDTLDQRRTGMHVVITGRYAPPELVGDADLVSEIIEVKHPYRTGVKAQKGLSSSMKLGKQSSRERFALEAGTAVLVALGLDILGEPPAPWHAVVWYGKLIQCLERAAPQGRLPQLLYGAVMLVLAAPAAFLPAAIVHWLAKRVRAEAIQRGCAGGGIILYALIEGVALKPFFALRMLAEAGRSVRLSLEQGDLPAARHALQSLVSRERSELTAELAGAAAIESLAENLSDSILAPLLYYTLFGLSGAAAYRLFNTFDSMVGYHGRYEYLGKAAARLDDALNLLPARLTALLIIALAPLFGGNRFTAWQIWRRDARRTASPNAGHPMAAAAGALGLQLEKAGHYRLGDDKTITTSSVRQAEQMVWSIGCVVVFLTAVLKTLWRAQHG